MPVIYEFEKRNFTGGSLTTSFNQNVVRKKKRHIGFGVTTSFQSNNEDKDKQNIDQKIDQKLKSHFGDGFYEFKEGHSS